jgi:hypothetical protein
MSNLVSRFAFAAAMMLPTLAFAQGAEMTKQYKDMCMKAVDMPKPFGEWDLKGNAKLPAYCDCFAPAFQTRAMKALGEMQANKPAPSLEQSNKEELELRNVCRKKVGLPLAVEPK